MVKDLNLAALELAIERGAGLDHRGSGRGLVHLAAEQGVRQGVRAVLDRLLALGVNPAHDHYLNLSALDRMQQAPDLWAPLIVQHERQVLGQVLDEPPPTGTTVLPRARL